ncbi:MAG: mycothione reductase [Mycobacterium sp.]
MRHHDLVIIGTGSGNMIVDDSFADLDVAIVEERKFGGTCVNFGCIPSKMLAYTAEVADSVDRSEKFGIDADVRAVHWQAIRDRVFGRTDTIEHDGRAGRVASDFITVYPGHARFVGPRQLHIDTDDGAVEITAEQIVVAAGSRPVVPPVVAESGLPYETSDTVMRIDVAPRQLAVLGGGYIAAELAHVFEAAGATITIIDKADQLIGGKQDEQISSAFTKIMAPRYDLRLGREISGIRGSAGDLEIILDDGSTVPADLLLVATGRRSNSDRLDCGAGGIDTHDDGRIKVDEFGRTTADGVFALGDVSTPIPLKHVANREAKAVAHNLRHPDDLRAFDHELVPSAVFADPQIASVGLTESECRDRGGYHVGATPYGDVAYGWALQDETGFCKVLTDSTTDLILGAHILGPQAATLIQIFVVAMEFGIKAGDLADRPYWIHPALTEVVENALQDLGAPSGV